MGGGSSSTNKASVFQQTVNDAFVSSLMQCSASAGNTQTIEVTGNNNVLSNIQLTQKFSGMLTCSQDAAFMTSMQNTIANTIQQAAAAQNVALLGALGNSSSDVETTIKTSVRNSINQSSVANLVSSIQNLQAIKVTGNNNVLSNITMDQFTSMISSNSQQLTSSIGVVNDISTKLASQSTATQTNPISEILDSLGNLLTGPFKVIAIMIAIVIGGAVLFIMVGGGDIVNKGIDAAKEDRADERKQRAV